MPFDNLADADPLDRDPETLWAQVIHDSWQHANDHGDIARPQSRA